ncbi:hypothetical protein EJ02DRAFT_467080 [Clathrospora elynae]|uniref:Uncharacterized protein n=1 Tax=Clathrospora elynae TaxID=706981 RepID=A0A6A5SMC3_9PLEO|nr:hypothetical protein EJ02DRAFT_467080 [Clathrospora elynae]
MPQLSFFLARADDDPTLYPNPPSSPSPSPSISHHGHLETGIIAAIIIVGLALLGCIATIIIKTRRKVAKRRAKARHWAVACEGEWYGGGVGEEMMGGLEKVGRNGGEWADRRGKGKKVAFVEQAIVGKPAFNQMSYQISD